MGDNKIRKKDEVLILIFLSEPLKNHPSFFTVVHCLLSLQKMRSLFLRAYKIIQYEPLSKNHGISFYLCTLLNLYLPIKFSFFSLKLFTVNGCSWNSILNKFLSYGGHSAALSMPFFVFIVGMLLGFTGYFVFSKGTVNLHRSF